MKSLKQMKSRDRYRAEILLSEERHIINRFDENATGTWPWICHRNLKVNTPSITHCELCPHLYIRVKSKMSRLCDVSSLMRSLEFSLSFDDVMCYLGDKLVHSTLESWDEMKSLEILSVWRRKNQYCITPSLKWPITLVWQENVK